MVGEGDSKPRHVGVGLLKLILRPVEGDIEDLTLLGIDVNLRVKLFEEPEEGLARGAPSCAEKESQVFMRVLELLNSAFFCVEMRLSVLVRVTLLLEEGGSEQGLNASRRRKQELRIVIRLL